MKTLNHVLFKTLNFSSMEKYLNNEYNICAHLYNFILIDVILIFTDLRINIK